MNEYEHILKALIREKERGFDLTLCLIKLIDSLVEEKNFVLEALREKENWGKLEELDEGV